MTKEDQLSTSAKIADSLYLNSIIFDRVEAILTSAKQVHII